MKTNLTNPLTYFILGPPRGGTTILCNLLNALEDGFCLGEPHWCAMAQNMSIPPDILSANYESHTLYGYKETYRLRHALCEDLLSLHLHKVDFFLIVLRDPVLVHSSQRALGWTEWDLPEDHNKIYRRLDKLAQHKKAIVIVYEDFVKDPLEYLNERLPFQIKGPLVLEPTGHAFGDPFANRSTEIVQSKREICLTEEEIKAHGPGKEIWQKYR